MRFIIQLLLLTSIISCASNTELDLTDYNSGLKILNTHSEITYEDYYEALEFFNKSVDKNPSHVESKFWKMDCELKLSQLDNSMQTSISVIENPTHSNHILMPHFYTNAGLIHMIRAKYDKSNYYFNQAVQIYDNRIEKNINDLEAIMNKSIVYCYMNKKDSAIAFLNHISLNEENQSLLDEIKAEIIDFDAESVINEMINNY